MPRQRRKSGSFGAELRGDTGASALSTLEPTPTFNTPPRTPPGSQKSSQKQFRPFSKRRKAKSLFRRWKTFSFRHTWFNPLIIILVLLAAYIISPTTSNPLHPGIFLSYPLPNNDTLLPYHAYQNITKLDPPFDFSFINSPTYYGKGALDFAFISFYIIVLTFTREFLMQQLYRPLAKWYGIRSRSKQNRFMEQVYTATYFAIFGPFGAYVMSRTPVWYFNTKGMFEGFPHRAHEGLFKTYYLLQASYWAQQFIVLVLRLEKPRKDFKELVGHHIVTLALIWLSYRFHFTYMGIAVYITHDISDFFLATSKALNYVDSAITTPYFTFFVGVWIYLRHYINIVILIATLTEFRTVGPYELNWETQQYKCWISQPITFGLLLALQILNIFWLYFILKVAYNITFKKVVKDARSDDEDTDVAVEEEEGEGYRVGISGAEATEKKGLENVKVNGINGKTKGGHGAIPVEGRKDK